MRSRLHKYLPWASFIGWTVLVACMIAGCASTPAPSNTTSTALVLQQQVQAAADKNSSLATIVNSLQTGWLQLTAKYPQIVSDPIAQGIANSIGQATSTVGAQATDLKNAGASITAVVASSTKDTKKIADLEAKPDPAVTQLKIWGGIAIGIGVLVFVASFFSGSIPFIGTYLASYGRAVGIGLVITGIILIGLAIYLKWIFWGIVAIAAGAGLIYAITHKLFSTVAATSATAKSNTATIATHAAVLETIAPGTVAAVVSKAKA